MEEMKNGDGDGDADTDGGEEGDGEGEMAAGGKATGRIADPPGKPAARDAPSHLDFKQTGSGLELVSRII